jgi:hypothetical protein
MLSPPLPVTPPTSSGLCAPSDRLTPMKTYERPLAQTLPLHSVHTPTSSSTSSLATQVPSPPSQGLQGDRLDPCSWGSALSFHWLVPDIDAPTPRFIDWLPVCRCGEVVPAAAVHGQAVLARAWPHHRHRVRQCDRTTSEMRGLSPKIISGDSRWSENAQTHTHISIQYHI